MPTYEYECKACQSRMDIWFRSFSAATTETPVCAVCGSKKLKRLLSSSAVIYPGSQSAQPEAAASTRGMAEESPQMLARAMKNASTGRDMGQEFDEVAARLDKGEHPKAIEKSLRKRRGQKMGPH